MNKKVLVVDDSRFILEEMRFLLGGSGFEITGYCKTGEEALEQYEALQPDVVTMDIILPGIDGIEATERIIKAHPEARVVVVSSLAYDDTMDRAKEVGAADFVFKPFDRQQLVDVLKTVCGA